MKSSEIRQTFFDYFKEQGHEIVPSSSLVPVDDPTLLFTNAGMNQFKEVFLGRETRPYIRAASSQRCVRAGGKHNDLENVGYTARHHTFFEMLGNFSFGDYFKREAIGFAWEFLTVTLGLPAEKLWITVHVSDDEAADIWLKEIGVSSERFSRLDEDNFWQMGDTGPCGPCSEIFYDHGEDIPGGPPGSKDDELDRYIEIWNLVFMQFNRQSDGEMQPLPKPSVDTGMGLERITAVMQHVHNNYEIDLFQNILGAAAKATGATNMEDKSLRVIADHIRSCSFLVADGIVPSNEGRGYVLRRIIRRAIRHGHKLGQENTFFSQLVKALSDEMGGAYPELVEKRKLIEKALLTEEKQFAKTLDQGMKILENDLADLKGSLIPGEVIFKLYDTYGFPADLTGDIAREKNLQLDMQGFEVCMEQQRERARNAGGFENDYLDNLKIEVETEFTGYENNAGTGKVLALFHQGAAVDVLSEGEQGVVVLDKTPFYAESGGQAGDSGRLRTDTMSFDVLDTLKKQGAFLHQGKLSKGRIKIGDTVEGFFDAELRGATVLNHSATHLMHAALREVLGDHVEQKGSLVCADYLRFDFSHSVAMTDDEIQAVATIVNAQIRENTKVVTEEMAIEQAREKGAMALFGEKYGASVRVLSMGTNDYSVELCGGTHAKRTGDIGFFKITSEGGVAAGVRRLEGVTGEGALRAVSELDQVVEEVVSVVKGTPATAAEKVKQLQGKNKEMEKEIARLKQKLASGAGGDISSDAREVKGVKVLATLIDGADVKTLRMTMDQLKSKLGEAAIVLAAVEGEKISLIAGVTCNLTDKLKAGEMVNHVASQVGGKGGGRADMAQAGGDNPAALNEALESVFSWVENKL